MSLSPLKTVLLLFLITVKIGNNFLKPIILVPIFGLQKLISTIILVFNNWTKQLKFRKELLSRTLH